MGEDKKLKVKEIEEFGVRLTIFENGDVYEGESKRPCKYFEERKEGGSLNAV